MFHYEVIQQLEEQFEMVEFGVDDIVRSGLVRDYLIAKLALGL